jgi:hypothetical protein
MITPTLIAIPEPELEIRESFRMGTAIIMAGLFLVFFGSIIYVLIESF